MTLDKIIEIAGKVQQFTDIFVPGYGGPVGLGVHLVKFWAGKWNDAHPNQEEQIALPEDSELIDRLAATSTRVVDTGTSFLDEG
jgi:hypothetical protein